MTTTADSATIDRWVYELRNYRTRRTARQKLIAAGATDAMVACLSDNNDSVVWAAVQSLPDMPDAERAIPKLIQLLERGVLPLDVVTALRLITGKDCGFHPDAWARETGHAKPTEPGSAPVVESLQEVVQHAGSILSVEATGTSPKWNFEMSLPGGRRQRVIVAEQPDAAGGDPLVLIYSPCAPVDRKFMEHALRLNTRLPAGAIGIYDLEGSPYYVMIDVLLAHSLDSRQLAKSIRELAVRADGLEQDLTSLDNV
jgi:hypothetical protein